MVPRRGAYDGGREHDMELDRINRNTFWKDAERRELGQINDYDALRDMGKGWNADRKSVV